MMSFYHFHFPELVYSVTMITDFNYLSMTKSWVQKWSPVRTVAINHIKKNILTAVVVLARLCLPGYMTWCKVITCCKVTQTLHPLRQYPRRSWYYATISLLIFPCVMCDLLFLYLLQQTTSLSWSNVLHYLFCSCTAWVVC